MRGAWKHSRCKACRRTIFRSLFRTEDSSLGVTTRHARSLRVGARAWPTLSVTFPRSRPLRTSVVSRLWTGLSGYGMGETAGESPAHAVFSSPENGAEGSGKRGPPDVAFATHPFDSEGYGVPVPRGIVTNASEARPDSLGSKPRRLTLRPSSRADFRRGSHIPARQGTDAVRAS